MRQWYQWLYLSIGFGLGGLLNYLEGRKITAAILSVAIFVFLAFAQLICDKKGQKGKRAFHYICILAIILLAVWLLFLIFK